VALFGSEFSLSCSEPERRVRVPMTREQLKKRPQWETRDYSTVSQSTGVLRMRVSSGVDHHKDFVDKDDTPLESRLNDVIVHLLENSITVAERDRRAEAARKAAAEDAARRAEAEIRQLEAEEARRREQERVNALVDRAERWDRACRVRAFVEAAALIEGYAKESWLVWARGVADKMDPLASTEDPDPPARRYWWDEQDS
jgi:hypothetical protein